LTSDSSKFREKMGHFRENILTEKILPLLKGGRKFGKS
jgi:hypothetical protein